MNDPTPFGHQRAADRQWTVQATATEVSITVTSKDTTGCPQTSALPGHDVTLAWDVNDPHALFMVCRHRETGHEQPWQFARGLLVHGGGEGDVRVTRRPGLTTVALTPPDGQAEIHLRTTWLDDVLDQILGIMPLGTEPSLADLPEYVWAAEFHRLLDGLGA